MGDAWRGRASSDTWTYRRFSRVGFLESFPSERLPMPLVDHGDRDDALRGPPRLATVSRTPYLTSMYDTLSRTMFPAGTLEWTPFRGRLSAFAVWSRKDGVRRAPNPTCIPRRVPPGGDR